MYYSLQPKQEPMSTRDRYIENPRSKGDFNNYVDKNRGEGVSRRSTVGHVKMVDSM